MSRLMAAVRGNAEKTTQLLHGRISIARHITSVRLNTLNSLRKSYCDRKSFYSLSSASLNLQSTSTQEKLTECRISSAHVESDSRIVVVEFTDETVGRYPNIYLRDICQCSKCWESSSQQRSFDPFSETDRNVAVEQIHVRRNGEIAIHWDDGHESVFPASFLRDRLLPNTQDDVVFDRIAGLDICPKLWGSDELQDQIPSVDFMSVLHDNVALRQWLLHVVTEGVCLMQNAPLEKGQLLLLGKRVRELSETHYGKEFMVYAEEQPASIAGTSNFLPIHSDLPYLIFNPCVQILHCVHQASSGGENEFVDGFHVAQQLKAKYPAMYELLTTYPMRYHDVVNDPDLGEFFYQYERPVIGTDRYGNVTEVLQSNIARSNYTNAPAEIVRDIYEALYQLYDLLYDKKNIIAHKLSPGEVVTFDNRRVLHGRRRYNSNERRLLYGGYLSYDDIYSRLRVLNMDNKM